MTRQTISVKITRMIAAVVLKLKTTVSQMTFLRIALMMMMIMDKAQ